MKNIIVHYDQETDILEVSIGNPVPASGLEIAPDIFEHYSKKTGEVVGLTILNFKERLSSGEDIELPINVPDEK